MFELGKLYQRKDLHEEFGGFYAGPRSASLRAPP
jgi:hypothetical protein